MIDVTIADSSEGTGTTFSLSLRPDQAERLAQHLLSAARVTYPSEGIRP